MIKNNQKISEKWDIKKLDDICRVVSGSTPKTSEPLYWNGKIAWVTPYDLSKLKDKYISNGNRNITELGLKKCSAELLPVNSLIMSSRAPIGYFAINKKPVATNQGCKSFICDKSINIEFLYYSLNQIIDLIKKVGSGSTFTEVGKSSLEKITILVPQKNIQQKIALILSTLDEEIQKTDQIIEKAEKLKNGLMNELLLNNSWNHFCLKDFVNDFIVPMRDKPKEFSGDIPWCRIEDFNGIFLKKSKTNKNVSNETIKNMKLRVYPVGTVLVSCSADLGRCAITANPLVSNQTFIGLVPSLRLSSLFLYYLMSFNAKRLNQLSSGTTIAYLSRVQFENFKVKIPDNINTQNKIADILYSIDLSILSEKENKEKLLQLKTGLMNDIFSQKVEVKNDY